MNEADTRARLIDPKLTESGWDVVEDSRYTESIILLLEEFRVVE